MRRAIVMLLLIAPAAIVGCERKLPDSVDLDTLPAKLKGPEETPLRYKLQKTITPDLETLRGVAVDQADHIYLVGDRTLLVLDDDGNELRRWTTSDDARCVSVAFDGTIYVGLTHRIAKYDADGIKLAEWGDSGKGIGQLGLITGIAVSPNAVYVGDSMNRCIVRYDLDGKYLATYQRRDREAGVTGLVVPSPHLDVTISKGRLIHNNPGMLRVEFRDLDGELLRLRGDAGGKPEQFCGCCNPVSVATTPDGDLVTSEKGVPRVKVYDPEWRLLAYIGPEHFDPDAENMDLAVDADGRILVIDPPAGQLLVFRRADGGPR